MGKKIKNMLKTGIQQYNETIHALKNKYYNLYRSNFKWTGLSYRQEEYIMKEYWGKGTVSAFLIKNADELGFAPWAMNSWDMYGLPEKVNLINTYGSPLVPSGTQIVDKDVVLGYIQSNKKPMSLLVDWYIERIAQVECVINTNLQLHKLPFVIPVDSGDEKKLEDIIDKILNNELCIFVEGIDPSIFKAVATAAPYIIDKLENYRKDLENDLKTVMGINNSNINKCEQLQLTEANANNGEIMGHDNDYENCLKKWCEQIKEVLGKDISVNVVQEERIKVDGQEHEFDRAPGPKGGSDDD